MATGRPQPTPHKTWRLTKHELRALIEFSSRDKTSINLHSVCFDGPNKAVVATDGYSMLVLYPHCAPGQSETRCLDRESMKALHKATPEKGIATIECKDKNARVVTQRPYGTIHKQLTLPFISINFPPWKQVIEYEESPTTARVGINGKRMALLQYLTKISQKPIQMFVRGEHNPIHFQTDGSDVDVLAVIMPERI